MCWSKVAFLSGRVDVALAALSPWQDVQLGCPLQEDEVWLHMDVRPNDRPSPCQVDAKLSQYPAPQSSLTSSMQLERYCLASQYTKTQAAAYLKYQMQQPTKTATKWLTGLPCSSVLQGSHCLGTVWQRPPVNRMERLEYLHEQKRQARTFRSLTH